MSLPNREPLPIDRELGRIRALLDEHGALVLSAAPGAGKTTRVPAALLDAVEERDMRVVVLEPRRIAARLAAERVATERGSRLGDEVGYVVRDDRRTSRQTRLLYMTDGVLAHRLLRDRELRDTAVLVLDEVHERRLETDLVLALAVRLRETVRPDLKLLCMSATLESKALADKLAAPVIEVAGQSHPLEVLYRPRDRDTPLEQAVARALDEALERMDTGDVLVFLPGKGEIERVARGLGGLAAERGLEIVPLHGELPAREAARALRPHGPRRVVLATNIAESSVTLPRVRAVIDTGLQREALLDPATGRSRLELTPIAQASATQRAGRAARLGPGLCIRLYGRRDLERRPISIRPEIERTELSQLALRLAGLGVQEPQRLRWWSPPPQAAMERARTLLIALGALEPQGALTALGRALLRYPLPPRLARLVEAARSRGALRLGAAAAVVLAEPGTKRARQAATIDALSDVVLEAKRFLATLESGRARSGPRVKLFRRLVADRGHVRPELDEPTEERAVLEAILCAFPDRVAKRTQKNRMRFAEGGGARLAPKSAVRSATWLVACAVHEQLGREPLITAASAIEPEWLLDLFADRLHETTDVLWNRERERVEVWNRLLFGALALDEAQAAHAPHADAVAKRLAREALNAGIEAFVPGHALKRLQGRLAFAARWLEGVAPLEPAQLATVLEQACRGLSSFEDLRRADLLARLEQAALGPHDRTLFERLCPPTVRLPHGRTLRVNYEPGREPWVAAPIAQWFGLRTPPRIAGGKWPLVLHLLAPNGRPVQITTDLAGFWTRHYPKLRRELGRRYPKHPWPEDPLSAKPPVRGKRAHRRPR